MRTKYNGSPMNFQEVQVTGPDTASTGWLRRQRTFARTFQTNNVPPIMLIARCPIGKAQSGHHVPIVASPNPQNPSPMGWTDHFDFSSEKRSLTKKIDREKAPEPEGDCIGAVHGATIWRLLLKICQSPRRVACQHAQSHTCRGLHKQETIHDGSTGQNKWVVRIR